MSLVNKEFVKLVFWKFCAFLSPCRQSMLPNSVVSSRQLTNFAETVTSFQRASTSHKYNLTSYQHVAEYNYLPIEFTDTS